MHYKLNSFYFCNQRINRCVKLYNLKTTDMKTKGLLLVAFLLGMLFSAQAADHVKGNGQLTTKKITIGDYNAIKIDGVIDFSYEQSEAEPYLEITVDENLHPYVNIDIKDRELTVNFKGAKVDHYTKFIVKTNSKWLKSVKAAGNANFMVNSTLTGDELKINANSNCLVQLKKKIEIGKLDLNVSGSANMVIDELQANTLECSINGSGTINLKNGFADQGKFDIATDGEIMAFGVTIPDASCNIKGKGSIQIHPTDNLKATVIGKGSIRYKGPTNVQQKVMLGGSVEEAK